MQISGIKVLVGIGICIMAFVVYFMVETGYIDDEVAKREAFNAKQKECVIVHDNTWKTIKAVAKVPQEMEANSLKKFSEVYPALMQGRYGNARGGSLMSWITESNPNFENVGPLYEKVSNAIESHRSNLIKKESQLLDMEREYNSFVQKRFARFFLGEKELLVAKVVSSTQSKEAFETGVDDGDIEVFGN